MEDLFLSFFDSFKEEHDAVEFYKADLGTMTMKQSSVLRIDYLHIKEYSPKPSYALISDSERN
ncbi:hypothetical protein GQ55_4G349800 [Panicum hallii var. hallii]|uniref:MCM N-terminal domain-containing protein n=1 Tax=Panicum hallii var. hallii TaxID=1504633 RepID=A0A2T7E3F4_9POAL|nr:hypothetical protein GQ55_4G349800 [Panicum hallii var. hallii]